MSFLPTFFASKPVYILKQAKKFKNRFKKHLYLNKQ